MNKAFTKTKELILDDNNKIVPDSDNGVVLIHIGEPKINKKGETVTNRIEYHYPRIAQALRKYADITLNNSFTFDALIENLNNVYTSIEKIDKEFKQF